MIRGGKTQGSCERWGGKGLSHILCGERTGVGANEINWGGDLCARKVRMDQGEMEGFIGLGAGMLKERSVGEGSIDQGEEGVVGNNGKWQGRSCGPFAGGSWMEKNKLPSWGPRRRKRWGSHEGKKSIKGGDSRKTRNVPFS